MDASNNIDLPVDPVVTPPAVEEGQAPKQESRRFEFDWNAIRNSPGFVPGIALTIGFLAVFWYMILRLPEVWLGEDGYYSHGFLVPLISGYVIYRWWPRIKNIKVNPAYIAAVPLLAVLWVARAATVNQIDSLTSVCMIFALIFGAAFIAGWRWMFALSLPILYLAFALPLWNMAITVYTNPLQVYSTKVAYKMLAISGFNPLPDNSGNIIYLNGFTLDVGVPCSGLKLVLALAAFTAFFMFIGNLRWWANMIMFLMVLPLALFINGLRIAMIGVVGVNYGNDAGHQFHDYSGYIALVVCFFILFRTARLLGWKD